jgi:hypothetical protein
MATVISVSQWRPRDGKIQEFVANLETAKKIHERLGAQVRVWQNTFGGQPMTVSYVIQHASWEDFGKFGQKMNDDNPTADMLDNSVMQQMPGID